MNIQTTEPTQFSANSWEAARGCQVGGRGQDPRVRVHARPSEAMLLRASEGARQLGGDASHRGTARLSEPAPPRGADAPSPQPPGQGPALLPAGLCLPRACPLLPPPEGPVFPSDYQSQPFIVGKSGSTASPEKTAIYILGFFSVHFPMFSHTFS